MRAGRDVPGAIHAPVQHVEGSSRHTPIDLVPSEACVEKLPAGDHAV